MAHFAPFSPFFALFAQKRRKGEKPRRIAPAIFGPAGNPPLGEMQISKGVPRAVSFCRHRDRFAELDFQIFRELAGIFEAPGPEKRPNLVKLDRFWRPWPSRPVRSSPDRPSF